MRYKFIFALIFGIFLIGFANATFSCNDFTNKWNYCTLMNLSGASCDNFWMEASDCNMSSMNLSGYYSKSQVEEMFVNFTNFFISNFSSLINYSAMNVTLNSSNSSYLTSTDWNNNLSLQVRDMITNYFNSSYQNGNSNQYYQGNAVNENRNQGNSSNDLSPVWALCFIVIIVGVIIIFLNSKKFSFKKKENNIPSSDEEILAKAEEIIVKKKNKRKNEGK